MRSVSAWMLIDPERNAQESMAAPKDAQKVVDQFRIEKVQSSAFRLFSPYLGFFSDVMKQAGAAFVYPRVV